MTVPLATALIGVTHIIVHGIIALAYVVAVINVPAAFASLIKIRKRTLWAGAGFFLFCGVTHFFLGVYGSNVRGFVTVTDHLQAPAIVLFLVFLAQDLHSALARFRVAIVVIEERFGKIIATEVRAIIAGALTGENASD